MYLSIALLLSFGSIMTFHSVYANAITSTFIRIPLTVHNSSTNYLAHETSLGQDPSPHPTNSQLKTTSDGQNPVPRAIPTTAPTPPTLIPEGQRNNRYREALNAFRNGCCGVFAACCPGRSRPHSDPKPSVTFQRLDLGGLSTIDEVQVEAEEGAATGLETAGGPALSRTNPDARLRPIASYLAEAPRFLSEETLKQWLADLKASTASNSEAAFQRLDRGGLTTILETSAEAEEKAAAELEQAGGSSSSRATPDTRLESIADYRAKTVRLPSEETMKQWLADLRGSAAPSSATPSPEPEAETVPVDAEAPVPPVPSDSRLYADIEALNEERFSDSSDDGARSGMWTTDNLDTFDLMDTRAKEQEEEWRAGTSNRGVEGGAGPSSENDAGAEGATSRRA